MNNKRRTKVSILHLLFRDINKKQKKRNIMEEKKETLVEKFIKKIKKPEFLISGTMFAVGVVATAKAAKNVAVSKKEVQVLRSENERLGKRVNEAWYHVGKLQQQLINNKKLTV